MIVLTLCELIVVLYILPCKRSSAGSLSTVSEPKAKAVHVMLVLFLSCDVTTVSVDMTEVDGSGTSVN